MSAVQTPAETTTPPADASTGELIGQLSEQTSRLIRDEMQLAQAELKASMKHGAVGAGMFGAAGMVALYGLAVLFAAAVAALALVLPVWASALIVGGVLMIAAAVIALVGKRQVSQASPTPQRTVDNVRQDVQQIKEASHGHA